MAILSTINTALDAKRNIDEFKYRRASNRFIVSFDKDNNTESTKIKASSPLDAINKVKKKNPGASNFNAIRQSNMSSIIIYNKDTKTFSVKWGKVASIGVGAMGAAATAVGLANGIAGLNNTLSGDKFSVVFKSTDGKPSSRTVAAQTPIDAINKVKRSSRGSMYKAFRMPQQDDQSQEYYNNLSNGKS